jgi:hypothetical protein
MKATGELSQLIKHRAMLERSGFGDDVAAVDGGNPVSDRFLDALAAIGDPEEASASVRRYRDAGAASPLRRRMPRTDFDATLKALAAALVHA